MRDADYLAVYDKKMLWRANLYIDEGNADWNNVHPWNAPHDGVATTGTPKWWSPIWGNNQWNRTYTVAENGIDTDLVFGVPSAGNAGKQVISLLDFSWTPLRSRTSAGMTDNVHSRTVAYDYDNSSYLINAWDSPFDFMYKMHEQRHAIRNEFSQYFNSDGTLKAGQAENASFPTGIGTGTIPLSATIEKSTLKGKDTTTAVNNAWKLYWKEPSPDGKRAYIPGLGLRYHEGGAQTAAESGTNVEAYSGTPPTIAKSLNFTNKASAGVDCVGFAQRSATYAGNGYVWTSVGGGIPSGRAEGSNPDSVSRTGKTAIPKHKDNYSVNILNRIGISEKPAYFTTQAGITAGPTLTYFNETIRPSFLRIVPGDVIWYTGDHVGIICAVDQNAMNVATSISELMTAVTIIESVYTGKVNYVDKRNMLEGGGITFDEKKNVSFHLNGEGALHDWNIERLIK